LEICDVLIISADDECKVILKTWKKTGLLIKTGLFLSPN
jgi:hypothetical protein